jgi:hypothetical protein
MLNGRNFSVSRADRSGRSNILAAGQLNGSGKPF